MNPIFNKDVLLSLMISFAFATEGVANAEQDPGRWIIRTVRLEDGGPQTPPEDDTTHLPILPVSPDDLMLRSA